MIRLLIIFIVTIFPTIHLWASDYDGNYTCEPTFVLTKNYLLIANRIDDIQVLMTNQNPEIEFGQNEFQDLMTNQNPEIELGLVDENKLEKMGMTLEDFAKFKTTEFRKHSFEMKISANTGQIIQTGQDFEADTYFENVLLKSGKTLMGYTEYSSNKTRTDELWEIRDFVFMGAYRDTLKHAKKLGFLDKEEQRKVIYSLVRNMLKELATIRSEKRYEWIEISQSKVPGTLNFSAENAGLLLNFNVDDTEKFRAVCKLI